MRHQKVGLLAFSLVLVLSSLGAAEPPAPISLDYRAPEGCPSRDQVMAEVTRLARLDPGSTRRVEATIEVRSTTPDAFTLTLASRFEGSPGERKLEGQSCRSVVNAATLILALMLNPDAVREPEPSAQPAETAPSPPEASAVPAASPTTPSDGEPWPVSGAFGALVGVRSGALPDPALELALSVVFGVGPIRALVDSSYLPSQYAPTTPPEAGGGRLWVLSLGGSLGYHVLLGDVRVGPDAGLEVTRLQGRGAKLSEPRTGTVYWTSVRVGLTGGFALSTAWSLEARVQALVPLARPSVFVEQLGAVHRPDPWEGRAGLGISYSWR